MKDFSNSAAAKALKKAADTQVQNAFFRPDYSTSYEVLAETRKITVAGKQQERLQVVAEDGKLSLVPATGLSGFFMTKESNGSNYAVIDGQTLDQVSKVIDESDRIRFVEGDDCLIYSRKFTEENATPKEGEVLIETSTKKFFMKPGKTWSIEGA